MVQTGDDAGGEGGTVRREKRPARRRWRVLLALASTLIAVGLLEVGLRVYARWTLQERGLTYHPQFGWAYLPNIRKVGRYWSAAVPAWTNSRGWRDAEASLAPPPPPRGGGVKRIVALGDSFTFGVAVDYGERFSELLESGRSDLEVINLGINASGTDQHLRILEVEGLLYRPDVVLLTAFMGNDLEDIAQDLKNSYPKPYYRLHDERLELVEPTCSLALRLRGASYLLEIAMQPFDRSTVRTRVAPEWCSRDTVPLFVALVRRMDEVSRQAGAHLLVALCYQRERVVDGLTPREAAVLASLRAAGLNVLDTAPIFIEAVRQGRAVYADDGHWSAEGHACYAAALREQLARVGWLR